MATSEPQTGQATGGVEDIIAELHERGVKSGRAESERIVAEARMAADRVLKDAEKERDRIVGEGRREAERLIDAARIESEQMLESFMASLPDMFANRATRLLDEVVAGAFDPSQSSETISGFLSILDSDRENRLKQALAKADPQSFLEGLMVMALAFYADAQGLTQFTLDSNLRSAWVRLMGDPESHPGIAYEFRSGISGFSVSRGNGRQVVVSPESIKHMAEAWASEEFLNVYAKLKVKSDDSGH